MDSSNRRSGTGPQPILTLVHSAATAFSIVDQAVVVALHGDLTAASVPLVRAHLLSLVDDGGPDLIVVDLSDVSSIDEAGALPLLEAHHMHSRRQGCMRLGAISAAVAAFLEAHRTFAATMASASPIEHEAAQRDVYPAAAESAPYEALRQEIEQLHQALGTRDVIGQAKGVIRVIFCCDADAAFFALVKLSQDSNRKVTEGASMIMDMATTGQTLPRHSVTSLQQGIDGAFAARASRPSVHDAR